MTDHSKTFSTRRRLASKINESTDVLWSNESLGEVTDAILTEFVIIPRDELPEVEDRGGERLLVGKYTYPRISTPKGLREEALRRLSVAEYLEGHDAEVKRRNELSLELSGISSFDYYIEGSPIRTAIDRIIELEARVSA